MRTKFNKTGMTLGERESHSLDSHVNRTLNVEEQSSHHDNSSIYLSAQKGPNKNGGYETFDETVEDVSDTDVTVVVEKDKQEGPKST